MSYSARVQSIPIIVLTALSLFLPPALSLQSASAAYQAEEIVTGLSAPLLVAQPPDGSWRLFIVEQGGRIKIFKNGSLLAQPFLDISAQVYFGGECGLLGLAFHPDYASNGYFYVNYTHQGEFCDSPGICSIVARFHANPGNADLAEPASRFEVLELHQPFSNHNGGNLVFGPDGYLYIGFGDGGSSGDPNNNAQSGSTLLGKMLRIDVDSGSPYGIPPDNPFVGDAALDEIWALGLRNPWRYSFDRLTGDLWIGDVGQNIWEEIDFQPASSPGGENYGWRRMEGNHCYNPPMNCDTGNLVHPVFEYQQTSGRCSITGGYVYRGGQISELTGLYLFADYCTGQVWALDPTDYTAMEILTSQDLGDITSFGQDRAGEIYLTASSGTVWKLTGDGTDAPLAPVAGGIIEIGPGYPNPFRQLTRFRLALKAAQSDLKVGVFSVDGRLLRSLHEGPASAGEMDLVWDGRDAAGRRVSTGVYLLRAQTPIEKAGASVTLLR